MLDAGTFWDALNALHFLRPTWLIAFLPLSLLIWLQLRADDPIKRFGDFRGGLIPLVRHLLQAPHDDVGNPSGQAGPRYPEIRGIVAEDSGQSVGRRLTTKRELPCYGLEKHDTKGEDIATSIEILAHRLFGRHVLNGPEDYPSVGPKIRNRLPRHGL